MFPARLYARLIAEGHHSPASRYQLARNHGNLGAALVLLNDPGSVEHYRKAIPLLAELVAEGDKNRDLPMGERVTPSRIRASLATAHRLLGGRLKVLGDPAAEKHLAQSATIMAELVADVPNVPYYRSVLAGSQLDLGDVLLASNRPADAEEQCRQAMGHLTPLVAAHPDSGEYRERLALCHIALGNLRTDAGHQDDAAEHYREAFKLIEDLVAKRSKDPWYALCLAWNLGTCLDPKFRDPDRAVQIGKQVVKMKPELGYAWSTLGVVHYRAGDWKAAVEALEQAMKLKHDGASRDWLFLAMAHWQLGRAGEARRYYDRAVQRMPSAAAFQRFRAEAATLLGLSEPPAPPKEANNPPPKK